MTKIRLILFDIRWKLIEVGFKLLVAIALVILLGLQVALLPLSFVLYYVKLSYKKGRPIEFGKYVRDFGPMYVRTFTSNLQKYNTFENLSKVFGDWDDIDD